MKKIPVQTSAVVHLERERSRLLAIRAKQLESFVSVAAEGPRRRLVQLFGKIRQTNDFLGALKDIAEGLEQERVANVNAKPRYTVSSLF